MGIKFKIIVNPFTNDDAPSPTDREKFKVRTVHRGRH